MEAIHGHDATPKPDRERQARPGVSAQRRRQSHQVGPEEAYEQQAAKEWVREHQDVALLAAFALGVFMGAWMRG